MTVAVAVVSGDGIVLAADSRTSFQVVPGSPTRVLSDFTHKVFRLGACGAVTYGWAFLNRRNISGHMEGLSREITAEIEEGETFAPADVVTRIRDRFSGLMTQHLEAGLDPEPQGDVLGFLVGGYEDDEGQTIELLLPSGTSAVQHSTQNPGAAWRGQTDVIRRLVKGVDLEILRQFAESDGHGDAYSQLEETMAKLEYVIPFHAMNLQDAIDFASFAIRLTIDTQRLTYGFVGAPGSWPGVGGPIELATITPTQDFAWLRETKLQGERASGEPEFG